jgi:RNA polymerase sigma factor (sigma-70 family)
VSDREDETALLKKCTAGDHQAREELFSTMRHYLSKLRVHGNIGECEFEDFVQDALLAGLKKLDCEGYSSFRVSFRAYCCGALRQLIYNYLRRRHNTGSLGPLVTPDKRLPDPQHQVALQEDLQRITDAIHQLTDEPPHFARTIFCLSHGIVVTGHHIRPCTQLTYEQIAAVINREHEQQLDRAAVWRRYSSAHKQIVAALQSDDEVPS